MTSPEISLPKERTAPQTNFFGNFLFAGFRLWELYRAQNNREPKLSQIKRGLDESERICLFVSVSSFPVRLDGLALAGAVRQHVGIDRANHGHNRRCAARRQRDRNVGCHQSNEDRVERRGWRLQNPTARTWSIPGSIQRGRI